ncbi:Cwf19-like protein [Macleaya cordata]|uniref:Cwf19-like protein n=1 Tax=Macleaya cordata TaxID=56857 RepID=A0A200QAS3_MACCD|nr:Cwf19-like protein [Macleaya cordata]
MLSGVKFIPRDQLNTDLDSSLDEGKKSGNKKEKHRRKKKNSSNDSSDDEGTEKIRKSSKKSKKLYSSDEYSSSSWSDSENDSDCEAKDHRSRRKKKKTHKEDQLDERSHRSKKMPKRRNNRYSSESYSSSASESEDEGRRGRRKHESSWSKERKHKAEAGEVFSDKSGGSIPHNEKELARKEMGLEWMLKPTSKPERLSMQTNDLPEEPQVDEVKKPNPREMNPYYKDDGSGFPEDEVQTKVGGSQLLSSSVVGDGGASWRLKALKRAQEQAARDGRKLEEVVEERWGSLGQLAVSAASRAAPVRAHLHAIRDRKRKNETVSDGQVNMDRENVNDGKREYLKDVSLRRPEMREPKVHDSLSWRKRKGQVMSTENAQIISSATSSLNKFTNDGSFFHQVASDHNKDADGPNVSSPTNFEDTERVELNMGSSEAVKPSEESAFGKQELSANQLAAKAMQLRMKGKHEEAEKLLKEIEIVKKKQDSGSQLASHGTTGSASRYVMHELSVRKKGKEEDADMHLAQKIAHNKQYSMSGRADDEYDFDDGPSRKRKQKRVGLPEQLTRNNGIAGRILTQQERCQFCFENPTRPKHLVVSIANFTYLMLPQWQPVVQGHCCILPMQHESATRSVDNNVWDEIRNFKKCLIKMFAKQERDVVFLETVMGLAKQRRHCLVECIPLPHEIARQAPLYFKKAIDEAEDEWSQHNAKKLIDTSEKGLRGSIPKDFPYFHVEFGLNKGFLHVIDDESQFNSSLGLNVIRGMLRLPEEDMYRRRKQETLETQRQAVAVFAQEWAPFDWTKQLD